MVSNDFIFVGTELITMSLQLETVQLRQTITEARILRENYLNEMRILVEADAGNTCLQ